MNWGGGVKTLNIATKAKKVVPSIKSNQSAITKEEWHSVCKSSLMSSQNNYMRLLTQEPAITNGTCSKSISYTAVH